MKSVRRVGRWKASPSLILTLAIPLVYLLVFGAFLFREGDSDWDQMLSFHELSLWNSKLYGYAKQWNPLMRGGMSLAGDPQIPILSPSMILAREIDPAAALKISAILFLLAGGAGTWLFARDLGLDPHTAALAASLFAGNGYIVSHLAKGHTVFLGTLGLPLWLWALRRALPVPGEPRLRAMRRLACLALAGGVFFLLSTDGAPITTLLLLVWVGLHASLLAWDRRCLRPLLLFGASVGIAAALDAVYYFPLAANALIFPRARPPVLIDPLLFPWFLILPLRGRQLPAPANGHEFSVYVGPVLAYLLFRYRGSLMRAWAPDERRRLIVVSAAVLALGLGSWRALGSWAPPGPFDLLHRLPGFVAIGIPARFWGYLALPLALLSAVAIRRLEAETSPERPRRWLWTGIFVFSIGFQAVSLALPFLSSLGRAVIPETAPPRTIHAIRNLGGAVRSQARELQPTTDLMEAYNLHDFVQGVIEPGDRLVLQACEGSSPLPVLASWNGWNEIRLSLPSGGSAGARVIFNENFHPRWSCDVGIVTRNRSGNLCLRLREPAPAGTTLTVRFRDPYSILGSRVSVLSGVVFLGVVLLLTGLRLAERGTRRLGLVSATPRVAVVPEV